MIKHITKRGGKVLNRLLLLLIVLSKVYMNSGSTHKAKDEVGRIWDLFKLSWAALNLSMSIMLLHWPCCFFFEAQDFFSSFCGFVYKISWEKLSRVELLLTYTAIRPFLITWMLKRPTMTYSVSFPSPSIDAHCFKIFTKNAILGRLTQDNRIV